MRAFHWIAVLSSISGLAACSGDDAGGYPFPDEIRVIGSDDDPPASAEKECDGDAADVIVGADGKVLKVVCYPTEGRKVADVDGDLLIDGDDVIVYGAGPGASLIGRNLEVIENGAVVRGVRIEGDAILRKRGAALVDCVIEGDLLVVGNENTIASCEIWGDAIIDGSKTVLVANLFAGDQQVRGPDLRCHDNRRFTDIEGDGVVQDDDVLGPVNCLPSE